MNTIVAVGGVLKKSGKYLLVQEAAKEFMGKWNLPAGTLDPNENLIEGAKREILEESGFVVEITGIAKIRNSIVANNTFIGFIFSTNITGSRKQDNIDEILQTKWFTYNEIMQMHNELRSYDWIVEAIEAVENNKICDVDLIGV